MTAMTLNHVGFWDALAERYAKQPVADPGAWDTTLGRIRHYLKPTDRVLEIGCGTGSSALKLADAAADYVATDFAPEMIRIARGKAEDVEGLRFEVADTRLEGMDGPFDAVVALNLLHLVDDLDASLKRAHEVLDTGGLFISKTPCLARMWYIWPVIKAMQLLGKAPSLLYFTARGFDQRIRDAGFELIEVAEHNKGQRGHFVVARKR